MGRTACLDEVACMFPDIDAVSRLIREVAATEILPRFNHLGAADSWEKRPGSVVTVADKRAEAALTEGLTRIRPGARVVGEEACEADPGILAALEGPGAVWIIDPVDGTANFAGGKPGFTVMIAFVVDGRTEAGWIYDPLGGSMSIAERGAGAWRDGARLSVAEAVPQNAMTGALGPRLRRDRAFSGRFAAVTDNRCCGVDYLALGAGRTHFAFYRALKPWDHAPGQLLHHEAGGFNACLDGTPYQPGRGRQEGLLLSPDRKSWRSLASSIRAVLARKS